MMPAKVVLHIANDHLACVLLHPQSGGGWRDRLRRGSAYLSGNAQQGYETSHVVHIAGKTSTENLPTLIQQGLAKLMHAGLPKTKDVNLEVELGASHAKVGLFQLESPLKEQLTEVDLQSHGRAWVQHSWGLDPSISTLRVSRLGMTDRYLVTCIDDALMDRINRVCSDTQMRFISCKPAMIQPLSTLMAFKDLPTPTLDVMAFAERSGNAGHYPVVECVATRDNTVLSISRVWVNPGALSQLPSILETVVQRLRAQHHHQGETKLQLQSWPAAFQPSAQVYP